MNLVEARCQEAPVLSPLGGPYRLILQPGHIDLGPGNGQATNVQHQTLDADVRLPEQLQQRCLVGAPLLGQSTGRRELAARELDGQFETVAEGIVEVLHAAG